MKIAVDEKHLPVLAAALVCVLVYASTAIAYPSFLSAQVAADLFAGNAPLGLAAVGMTFVILCSGIDLSVASVMALATMIVAALTQRLGLHPAIGIAAALAAGAVIGLANGALILAFDLPPFLVTLAMLFLARGCCFLISMEPLPLQNPFFDELASAGVTAGPVVFRIGLFALLIAVAAGIIVARATPFGRYIYALGGSEPAARLMGLPVGRTKLAAYLLSGLCAAAGGVLSLATISSGDPSKYLGLELNAIAAVVIGGTLLSGGVGYVFGTLLGVLILGTIQGFVTFNGSLSESWTQITTGLLLFIFIALQRVLVRMRIGGRRNAVAT